jgi:predicted nucleotidyltransferase
MWFIRGYRNIQRVDSLIPDPPMATRQEIAMIRAAQLFETVPQQDYLGFWADQTLNARKVADFLDLDKREVAKVASVAPASVRFDQKIPKEVLERLEEIANVAGLVAQFFHGDPVKTALWFKTKNPLLGEVAPRDMIRAGRYETLRRFVLEALKESAGMPGASPNRSAPAAVTAIPARPRLSAPDHPLIAQHHRTINRLCKRFGVRRLAAFGSILREDFDPATSDVDFVVEFKRVPRLAPARQYFDFKSELERVLDRPVDLVELKAMPDSRLKRIIERTQVPVYGQAA